MSRRTFYLVLVLAAFGCGGGTETADPTGTGGGEATEGETTATETAEVEVAPLAGLASLSQGETLTFLVHSADIEDSHVRLDVTEVVRKGAGVAVKLTPVGIPLDGSPIYVGWVIANEVGLFALEPHVSLTEPGFVPIDEAGQLVTEATASIAWHVPTAWLAEAAGAFETSTQAGWSRGGYQASVEGAIHGEGCAELRRSDSDLSMRMTVCRNLGMIELVHSGGADDTEQFWRLVDVGVAHTDTRP